MTIDQWLARNGPVWARLDELTRRAGKGARRLDGAELAELVALYQRVSTHLSYARGAFDDPALNGRLSLLVSSAGAVIYGTRPRTLRALAHWLTTTFPAAVWHCRRAALVAAGLTFVPALALGVWIANSPRALDAAAPPALRQAYVAHDFGDYYRSSPSAEFATEVYTNNVKVALATFATGVALVPPALLLADNGANLGFAGGLFAAAGKSGEFYGDILPHGLIELTSVVVAGAAGLHLGWSLVAPGDRTRRAAFADAGRRAVVLVLGTVITLAVAGTIEGFVTGSALPTWVRVGIGVTVEVAFLAYVVACGRRAAALGFTGAVGEGRYSRPVALTAR